MRVGFSLVIYICIYIPWFLYQMVAHFTMRTYGVNQEFRFAEGIWLHRKSRQIRFFFGKDLSLHHTCATCSEQPSHIKTIGWVRISSALLYCIE